MESVRGLSGEGLREQDDADDDQSGVDDAEEAGVAEAAVETDPAKRVDLYAQAEDILVNQDAAIIPIYWYTNLSVTKPNVTRTFSVGGHQIYYKWDIAAK